MRLESKLAALRKQHGYTQLELAQKLNVSRQAISRWESGVAVPSTDNLKYLSELYDVTVDYLLKEDIPEPEAKKEEAQTSFSESQEIQESAGQTSWWKGRTKKQIGILCFALGFVLAIGIAVAVSAYQEWEENRIVPQEEMERDVGDDGYPVETFDLHLVD